MREFPTILDLIGHTPVIRLPQIQPAGAARVLAKLEYVNPGGSIKDRIALPMIEAAERDGRLRPGGTIVEATSGNTGVGLAMVAAQRGYRCIFVMPDKMSREKIALLRAFGAEVVVCPTEVEPEDPRSYYSVSERVAHETPGAYNPNQYANSGNPQAHYDSTGPEIWEQVGDELDVLVTGVGTGGTVTGTGRYLKERKPDLQIVGADPIGSIYSSEQVQSYLVEGVGEDFWPTTFDRDIVDRWLRVSDREAFSTTRRLARLEGILIGASGGMALHAALRVATELPPDKTVLERFGIDPHRPVVAFVGRITRQKGVDHALAAAESIDAGAQVVLCAGAPDTPEIGEEMRRWAAALTARRGGVVWIEEMLAKPDLVAILTAAAVFICPSVYEPFGLTNLEAMACETAVVASAVGGIPEIVVEDVTGHLVPLVADAETFAAALAGRVNALLADPSRAAAMGRAGRLRAIEHFGWPAVAARTVGLYERLLGT